MVTQPTPTDYPSTAAAGMPPPRDLTALGVMDDHDLVYWARQLAAERQRLVRATKDLDDNLATRNFWGSERKG